MFSRNSIDIDINLLLFYLGKSEVCRCNGSPVLTEWINSVDSNGLLREYVTSVDIMGLLC